MEVVVRSPLEHYAYLSSPSSPNRFGEYYPLSAPTSPSRLSEFYREFDYFSGSTVNIPHSASSSIPFEAGTATATATSNRDGDDDDDGFAFSVTRESDKSTRSAEELFHDGKIKPLKPQNLLDLEGDEIYNSPTSPLLSQTQKKEESHSGDPFATEQRRGRDRTLAAMLSSSNSGRRVTRSHSPYRISHSRYSWDEEQHPHQQPQSNKEDSTLSSNARASLPSTSSSSSSKSSSRKWRFRDFLLFRSASEGRGSSKDPLKKYSVLYKRHEEVKNSSVRSSDSPTTSAPGARTRGPVSPHELHYAMKKAESEDLRKRTFLPYKQGILGRLAGLGSLTR